MGNSNQNKQIILLSGKLKEMKLLAERGDYIIYEHIEKQKQYEYWVWKSEQNNYEEAELTAQDFRECDSITKISYQSRGCITETFKKEYIFAILMEHPTYDLYEYLKRKQQLNKKQIVNMVTNIFGAQRALKNSCQYLGFHNIYTMDGESWMLKPFQKVISFVTNSNKFVGYPAPEEFNSIQYNVEKATVFSFGMLMLHLILNKRIENVQEVYKVYQSIDVEVLDQRIQELQQTKDYEQDFIRIIIRMIAIDPNQRPDYSELVDQLTNKNNWLTIQQKSTLSQIQFKSQNSKNSGIINGLISVPLEKEEYMIKILNSKEFIQNIDEDEKDLLESSSENSTERNINKYTVINYDQFITLDKAFDYNDLTNVMDYTTRFEGNIQNSKKNGPGTLYLSNNEVFQGNFINNVIEGKGQFLTIDKHIVRGVWKQYKLSQQKSIQKSEQIFSQKSIQSPGCQLKFGLNRIGSNSIPEEIIDQKYNSISEQTTLTNGVKEQTIEKASVQSKQIVYHSTYDQNNRLQGYVQDEQGMVMYAGLFRGDQYDGYGVLKNFNYQNINMINHLDLNKSLRQNAWIKYDGEFRNGKKHGKGKLYFSDKSVYQGQFEEDQIFGEGVFTNSQNQVIQGYWIDGQYQNPIK
ncbi:unnamed protein product [Paramecium sonneborni]|uniref:Protein kinase domain-containing protein n=1 Tax=Paramecium sonneborni TaxID=65129 RepID=A0A8S1QVX2_9CILI|nr:unnamed protein product [Paramecium sonneborni]